MENKKEEIRPTLPDTASAPFQQVNIKVKLDSLKFKTW